MQFRFHRPSAIALCALYPTIACAQTPLPPTFGAIQNTPQKELYLPKDGKDYSGNDHEYSHQRKVETPNFALFWAKEYGEDPAKNSDPNKRFDANEVLRESERIYDIFVNKLKFVEKGNSLTDKYKALIYVTGGPDGTAYGGGEDKKIGVFWTPAVRINRGPYGVVAHELGHSFQYLVGADGHWGFSSTPEGSKANPIWEMTSQYMLWQVYPEWMTFENYHLNDFMQKTHLAFLHESNQYHSPYVLEYWSNQHGVDFVGRLWRQAQRGEDAVMAYQRLTKIDQKTFNDEIFDAARRFITWDMKRIETVASRYANGHSSALDDIGDGWYRIAASRAPQNYGYNGIQLQVPAAGTTVSLDFKGVAGAEGFRAIKLEKAGWRYGFVASKTDGSRVYSPMFSSSAGKAQFVVPAGCKYLWLVVSGAPTEHWQHISDNEGSTDEQWPYQFKLSGTVPDASLLDKAKRDARVEKETAEDYRLWQQNQLLAPLQTAMRTKDGKVAAQVLADLQARNAPAEVVELARVQIATLQNSPQETPANFAANTLFLSEAKPTEAKVGWFAPSYNRLPEGSETTIFAVGEQLFARGIWAHAPARHVYDLGGKWKRLSGKVGIQRGNDGRVGFSILADGKPIWQSGTVREGEVKTFDIPLADVQTLTLEVADGGNGAANDWGLWLDPKLTR